MFCRLLQRLSIWHLKIKQMDTLLIKVGAEDYLKADGIVACYHERGSDELAYRELKDFGHEQLPFIRFNPNADWCYSMLLGHFLMDSFKEDVGIPILSVGAYATMVRRKLIDIADKIVSHSEKSYSRFLQLVLKIFGCLNFFNAANMHRL